MHIRNVLVFPAGTEIGLEIFNALKDCKDIKLFAAGVDVSNHAQFVYGQYHVLPSIHETRWLEALEKLCEALDIDYIYPTHDDIVVVLSQVRDRLPATVISPSAKACEITRSKSKTYAFFRETLRVPEVYKSLDDVKEYPVFIKPDQGQGANGAQQINNRETLMKALADLPTAIISEYLPGEEYTVDCFSDREEGVLFAGARVRNRMKNGIAVNTKTVELSEAALLATKIGEKLALHGAWYFQLKRATDGALALLEVAPRIAGSMAAHRVQGINFPLLSIYEHERIPISILNNKYTVEMDRALTNRYKHNIRFDVLYVDLDDTLILKGKVNEEIVKFIFHCINHHKKVVLLTKHRFDLQATLAQYRLAGLFDEIIHVSLDDKKSRHIKADNAIFIDDSFRERLEVATECGIATFDASMIEIISRGAGA